MTFFNNTFGTSVDGFRPQSTSPLKKSLVLQLRFKRLKSRQELKRIILARSSAPASSTTASVAYQPDLQNNTLPAPPVHPDHLLAQLSNAMHQLQEERDTAISERNTTIEQRNAFIQERVSAAIRERNEAVEEARKLRVENKRLEDSLFQFQRAISQALTPPGAVIEVKDEAQQAEQ